MHSPALTRNSKSRQHVVTYHHHISQHDTDIGLHFINPKRITTLLIVSIAVFLLCTTTHQAHAGVAGQDYTITAKDGTDLGLMRYAAKGEHLIIWLAPSTHERVTQVAGGLAQLGIEVWQIDLAEALFLPNSTEQMRSFNGKYVAELIRIAHAQTHKKILLAARGYGSIPLLRGARLWQTQQANSGGDVYLKGAILFSPDLYSTIPALGLEPQYVPITYATNIPLMIIQDGKRGNRNYLDRLANTLLTGGSQPMLKILPGVAGLFFSKDDSTETLQAIEHLPHDVKTAISLLEKLPTPRKPAPMTTVFKPLGSGLDSQLRAFKGKFQPYPIDLATASGSRYRRDHYQGQITIVNFWATWCSPCVKEIPSLNRLRTQMQGMPFELISINFSESIDAVHQFMKKVDVEFPVLLDSDGGMAVKWKVLTLPSTFIIGPDGKIRYGVNAAIHWDNPDVVSALKQLLPQNQPH